MRLVTYRKGSANPRVGADSLLPRTRIEPDRHRTVVDERDLHMRAEYAGRDWLSERRG